MTGLRGKFESKSTEHTRAATSLEAKTKEVETLTTSFQQSKQQLTQLNELLDDLLVDTGLPRRPRDVEKHFKDLAALISTKSNVVKRNHQFSGANVSKGARHSS